MADACHVSFAAVDVVVQGELRRSRPAMPSAAGRALIRSIYPNRNVSAPVALVYAIVSVVTGIASMERSYGLWLRCLFGVETLNDRSCRSLYALVHCRQR